MFAKIKNDFLDSSADFTKFKSTCIVDSYYSAIRKGGSSFLLLDDHDAFWKLHSRKIFSIMPSVRYAIFTGEGLVTPHTDGGRDSVALNFYITAPGDSTIFYEKKHEGVKPYPNTNAYNVNELTEVARFRAYPKDMYLLDVQKIHGIEKSTSEDRVMISYRWKSFSFEQIYNSLIGVEKKLWNELV